MLKKVKKKFCRTLRKAGPAGIFYGNVSRQHAAMKRISVISLNSCVFCWGNVLCFGVSAGVVLFNEYRFYFIKHQTHCSQVLRHFFYF